MTKCAVTGSYDPITLGHMYLIESAARDFDEVYAVALINEEKTYTFSMDDRLEFMRLATAGLPNVKVYGYDGLAIDFCKSHGIDRIVRGFRNETDLEYERGMAQWNYEHGGVYTLLLPCDESMAGISSSCAREYIRNGGDLGEILPAAIADRVKEKMYGQDL